MRGVVFWPFPILLFLTLSIAGAQPVEQAPVEGVNSIGMRFVTIQPGTFRMGNLQPTLPAGLVGRFKYREDGDHDESPVHEVRISRPFRMSVTEVTNRQYEEFDPSHRFVRGKLGFSVEDDEAVVFVTWHEAMAFCQWLSRKEGKPYRLPTEAEWEYACRAGSETIFNTGDSLPESLQKNVGKVWYPDPFRSKGRDDIVPLHTGKTPPNTWGLYDMHGNVEEWCLDWYGPYPAGPQVDPVGRVGGDFKVTRGGSHSTELYYLRSANRLGVIPEDRNWVIGFRVVQAAMPGTEPLPLPELPRNQQAVQQHIPTDILKGPDPEQPYFQGPRPYVVIEDDFNDPIFPNHNHVPNLVEANNGDLFAIWYTTVSESDRELAVAASRLRYGEEDWDPASIFWDQPDRNDHTSALWVDEQGTLFHFNGFSVGATWGSLAVILRKSHDNGRSWSKASLILPEHDRRQMVIETIFRTRDGRILLPCDAVTGGDGGTAVYLSSDNGTTWQDSLGTIAGIHAGVAQLEDGRLIAFGRGDNIEGNMPKSLSSDMGRTWAYSSSGFPPVGGGQRPLVLRLREGPLCLISFTGDRREQQTMEIIDTSGTRRPVSGMFAAISYDGGDSWPNVRLVSDDGPGREVETMDGRLFTMGFRSAEPGGYNSIWQARNGVIHLISSRQHYEFNLKWLETPPPAR